MQISFAKDRSGMLLKSLPTRGCPAVEWDKGMKLTIYRKLLLSYLAMAFLTVLASAYAIFSLQQLNDLASRIINEDFAVVDQSKACWTA